jgi:flagellar L-ring protein FlgH
MQGRIISTFIILTILLSTLLAPVQLAYGESLFKASAQYQDNINAGTPKSLFTQPQPKFVGDMVTVLVNDQIIIVNTADVKLSKTHTLTENGSTLLNNAVTNILDKIPFVSTITASKLGNKLSIPTFNGLDNANNQTSKTQNSQVRRITDTITCQVVQVLQNGFLQVEGKKALLAKKEESVLYVTGIVNPYFIDKQNQITSNKIANLEYRLTGHGIMTRQQGDSIANKLYQFFE